MRAAVKNLYTPILFWTSIALLCANLGAAVDAFAQTQRIRIAYSSRSNTATPFYIAASKGFFREEGLDVELIQVSPRLGAMAVINGDVSFTTSFTSTFRGILQGLPLKLVLIVLKKGAYFLVVRPEIRDIQELKGKKLGVATIRGTDHMVAEELLRSKGFDSALMQPIVLGDTLLRAQALAAGVVQAVSVSPPHDLLLQQMGHKVLAGPPEVGMPASGLFAADRLLKENPQIIKRTLRAVLKANRFIEQNREETIAVMTQSVKQTPEIAARSYDVELKTLARDGQMSDAEIEHLIERLGEKKRPLDEVRDFSHVRQALKELAAPGK
ncbi:MAG TPA: ABC transporter substrate-binding protein [Candidatus Eisenbacteria bacterium]|nr:ABC transporter substrate-binding protein [Candidatus Eisenbacteria bacterium]